MNPSLHYHLEPIYPEGSSRETTCFDEAITRKFIRDLLMTLRDLLDRSPQLGSKIWLFGNVAPPSLHTALGVLLDESLEHALYVWPIETTYRGSQLIESGAQCDLPTAALIERLVNEPCWASPELLLMATVGPQELIDTCHGVEFHIAQPKLESAGAMLLKVARDNDFARLWGPAEYTLPTVELLRQRGVDVTNTSTP